MSSNRPEVDGDLPDFLGLPIKRTQIVVTCHYHNDPRQRRVVITERGAHPVEICERDALGNESWRTDKDPPAAITLERMLARALLVLATDNKLALDLGKISP